MEHSRQHYEKLYYISEKNPAVLVLFTTITDLSQFPVHFISFLSYLYNLFVFLLLFSLVNVFLQSC